MSTEVLYSSQDCNPPYFTAVTINPTDGSLDQQSDPCSVTEADIAKDSYRIVQAISLSVSIPVFVLSMVLMAKKMKLLNQALQQAKLKEKLKHPVFLTAFRFQIICLFSVIIHIDPVSAADDLPFVIRPLVLDVIIFCSMSLIVSFIVVWTSTLNQVLGKAAQSSRIGIATMQVLALIASTCYSISFYGFPGASYVSIVGGIMGIIYCLMNIAFGIKIMNMIRTLQKERELSQKATASTTSSRSAELFKIASFVLGLSACGLVCGIFAAIFPHVVRLLDKDKSEVFTEAEVIDTFITNAGRSTGTILATTIFALIGFFKYKT